MAAVNNKTVLSLGFRGLFHSSAKGTEELKYGTVITVSPRQFGWKYLLIALLILSFMVAPVFGEDLIIYTEHSPFAQYVDEQDGKAKGYVYELIVEMQKRMQDTTPIQFVPWARGYHYAATRPNTVLFSTTFTEERRPLFKWVGPVIESVWVFYAAAGSNIEINSLDDARSVKGIGTYFGDARELFLKNKGFTNLDSVPDDKLNLRKLVAGRINLWISSRGMGERIAKELGIPEDSFEQVYIIDEKGLFIAFHKDTKDEIIEKWAKSYQEVREGGTMKTIYDKWNVSVPMYEIPPAP